MLLAGDIGGTKTILAIYSAEGGLSSPLKQQTYSSTQFDSLETMIGQFLDEVRLPVERACFGVAGPVIDGRANITNLTWVIDAQKVKDAFGLSSVHLINDLEAVAYAIPRLAKTDVLALSEGKAVAGGSISVVAPGTGLGEAYLTEEDGHYVAHASEGAHTDFAPTNETQQALLSFLWNKGYTHVSYERVCSGRLGIPNLYAFLKEGAEVEEPAWLKAALDGAEDITPVVLNAALDSTRPCKLCQDVLQLFVDILGAEAGNHALKIMATGGIYLGGGMPPRLLPHLQTPRFLENIRAKGRFAGLLADVPVYVILNSAAGLIGAAAFGFDH